MAEITSYELVTVPPDMPVQQAAGVLGARGIDQAPVADDEITRHVTVDALAGAQGTVADVAVPIEAADMVAASAGLALVIPRLRERPFLYVLGARRIEGVVTRADLQLPPVAMAVLGLIVSVEVGLSHLLDAYTGGRWMELLSPEQREEVRRRFRHEKRRNTELTELECMDLVQRFDALAACEPLWRDLGFASRTRVKRLKGRFTALRNPLAHGRSLFCGDEGFERVFATIEQAIDLSERVWSLLGSR